jgi:hypothetical protein
MKSTHLRSPRSCPLRVASSPWLFLAALVTHVPSSRIRPGKGSSMGIFPAFALSDEVAANHHDNATNHDDICPDVVRGGPKSQHCPQEDVHRTQAE